MSKRRPRIVLAVGFPGSGKSTYLKSLAVPVLSSDALRELILDNVNDQTQHARIFAALRYLLLARLEAGRPVTYIDATHLSRAERRQYFELAAPFAAKVEVLWIDTPLEVCKARNLARDRVVPEEAYERMLARFQPPAEDEGFAAITVVRPPPVRPGRRPRKAPLSR